MPIKRKRPEDEGETHPHHKQLIHPKSCPSSKSELSISYVPPTQTAIERAFVTEYRPVAAVAGNTPLIEFLIPANAEHYIDFDDMFLYIRFKATAKKSGADLASGDKFYPVQNLLHSMISKVDLVLQDKNITPSSQYYSYRAYFEKTLGYSKDARETFLRSAGWYTSRKSDHTDIMAEFPNGTAIEVMDRLHLDLCNQERLMLNGVQVKLSLQLHKPEYYFQASTGVSIDSIAFEHVALFVKHAKLSDYQAAIHKNELMRSPALYPISRNEVRQFLIPIGVTTQSLDNVFNGQIPRRIFLAMVKNKSEQGTLDTDPYNFEHNDINYLACYVNGEQHPSIAYTPMFTTKCIREYMDLYKTLNQLNPRPTPAITFDEFKKGSTIFGFNLSPDQSDGCEGHYNLIKRGNVRFELKLGKAPSEVISVILFCEFDNIIQVDANRNVTTDYC